MNAETKPQRLADRVESAAAAGVDAHTGLPTLAIPPPEFPEFAVWEYMVASQTALGGLTELEAAIQQLRRKLKVCHIPRTLPTVPRT